MQAGEPNSHHRLDRSQRDNHPMIEHRPSDMLTSHLNAQGSHDAYDIQQRQQTLKGIRESLQRNCTLDHVSTDFDQLSTLCEHSIQDTNLQQKSHLVDLAICYLDYLKLAIKTNSQPLSAEQIQSLSQLSDQLSGVACRNRDQFLAFSHPSHPGDRRQNRNDSENESCKLLDLLMLTEIVIFSLLVNDQKTLISSISDDQIQPTECIGMTEDLLHLFDSMIISEGANTTNQIVAQNLLTRQDQGILTSISELVNSALLAYPDQDRATHVIVQLSEQIYLKAVTSPLVIHQHLSSQILMSLMQSTDFAYHSAMGEQMMVMIEALYIELKTGKQDPFKKKVLNKLCSSITFMMGFSNAKTCLELIKRQHEVIRSGKIEMVFLLFTTHDGKLQRQQIVENYALETENVEAIFKEVKDMCETMIKRLEKFVSENSGRMEKSQTHKYLTLMLSPLVECFKLCGNDAAKLPKSYRERITQILTSMKAIFKIGSSDTKTSTPPTNLIESYIELTLLANQEFNVTNKLDFETYFKIFMHVKNLLQKAPQQNVIPMAKVVRLCTKVDIPEDDKKHFYQDFGVVVKKLLSTREPHSFFYCLSAFMEWAAQTELSELNFMVPEDDVVQNLLSMFMEKERIDLSTTGHAVCNDERLMRLQDELLQNGLQDVDIMEKFCAPSVQIPLRLPTHMTGNREKLTAQQNQDNVEQASKSPAGDQACQDESLTDTSNIGAKVQESVPPVAMKLVEVQLMIKGKPIDQAASVAQSVYSEFQAKEWPGGGSDAELQTFILSYQF